MHLGGHPQLLERLLFFAQIDPQLGARAEQPACVLVHLPQASVHGRRFRHYMEQSDLGADAPRDLARQAHGVINVTLAPAANQHALDAGRLTGDAQHRRPDFFDNPVRFGRHPKRATPLLARRADDDQIVVGLLGPLDNLFDRLARFSNELGVDLFVFE